MFDLYFITAVSALIASLCYFGKQTFKVVSFLAFLLFKFTTDDRFLFKHSFEVVFPICFLNQALKFVLTHITF